MRSRGGKERDEWKKVYRGTYLKGEERRRSSNNRKQKRGQKGRRDHNREGGLGVLYGSRLKSIVTHSNLNYIKIF